MVMPKISSYTRWLPTLIVSIAVIAILTGGLILRYMETRLVMSAGEGLTLAAVDIAGKLDLLMAERYGDIQLMANSRTFQEGDAGAMRDYMKGMVAAYQVYEWVGMVDATGRIVAATDPDSVGKDRSERQWFLSAKHLDRIHIRAPKASEDSHGIKAIAMSARVKGKQGEFLGVVSSRIALPPLEDTLVQTVMALQAQWGTSARIEYQLIDLKGELIADSLLRDEGDVNLKRMGLPSAQLVDSALPGFVEERHLRRNVEVLTGYAATKGIEDYESLRWGVLVRVDRADILVPIRAVMWKIGAAGAGMLLPLVAILLWSTTRVTRLWGAADKERIRAQVAERKFHTLVDLAPDAIVITDTAGKILLTNRQVDLVFGYSQGRLIGQPIEILVPESVRDIQRKYSACDNESVQTGSMGGRYLTGRRQEGTEISIDVRLSHAETEDGSFTMAAIRDISQQVLEEVERERLGREVRLLLDSTVGGLYGIDRQDRCIFINRAGAEQLGYRVDELLGKDMHRLIHHTHRDGSPYAIEDCPIYRASQGGQGGEFDDDVLWRKDGTSFLSEIASRPIYENGVVKGAVVTFLDITERQLAQESLRKSESRTRQIIESALDAFVGMDANGKITDWNAKAEQMFGWTRLEAIGQRLSATIIPVRYRDAHEQGIRRFLDTGEARVINRLIEIWACHRDGHEFAVELAISANLFSGGDYTFSAFIRDVSVRKEAERELLKAKELAEASVRAKSAFLATMSHEIRTPMNGVIGMTGLLLDTDLTQEQREFAEIVRTSGDHLLTVINDILDFSKIEAGKLTLEIIDFDLRTAVDEAVDLVAERAFSKGVNLACLFHADVPAALRGDPGRLRQILLNLLGNAIKFTERGDVVLSVTLLQQTATDATVRLEVQDTGMGLSADVQERLFESFMQADSSTTRKFGGTGLGLAICKQLTECMGGSIGVESKLGEGSIFWFTVQLGKQADVTASAMDLAPQDLRGLQLCIVDDHPVNRRILALYAERWGAQCLLANDGQQALTLMRQAAAGGRTCDLAIIDMQLPGINGLELGAAIKADPALASTRLVLLTSQGRRGDGKAAQAAGYAGYLSKPVHATQLYECLTTVLKLSAETSPHEGQPEGLSAKPALVTRYSLAERSALAAVKILVAEDNVVNQKFAVRILEKLGYRADLVANGLEALEALSRISYDAVLMDCQMPEMDGFQTTRLIRERERARGNVELGIQNDESTLAGSSSSIPHSTFHIQHSQRLPIIAMTANALKEDRDRCLAAGMDDYVSKPVNGKILGGVLARWVSAPPASAHSTDERLRERASGEAA
jgi:PAS domain S-box-containing protein